MCFDSDLKLGGSISEMHYTCTARMTADDRGSTRMSADVRGGEPRQGESDGTSSSISLRKIAYVIFSPNNAKKY